MKMANMDSFLGYMFTNPTDKNGVSKVVFDFDSKLFSFWCKY